MNCQTHPEKEAAGTCVYCGKFFCADCLVDVNGKNYCKEHVSNAFNEQKQAAQQGQTININNTSNSVSNATANAYAGYGGNTFSSKSRLVSALLCFFFGVFGIHRFYVGKIGTGILYLLTLGFGGFGVFIDLILILVGSFRDKTGLQIKNW